MQEREVSADQLASRPAPGGEPSRDLEATSVGSAPREPSRSFRVRPSSLVPKFEDWFRGVLGCQALGCLAPAAVCASTLWVAVRIARAAPGAPSQSVTSLLERWSILSLVLFVVSAIGVTLVKSHRSGHREAERVSQELNQLLGWFSQQADHLWATANQAERLVQRAERDFEERAFGPFWDSMEQAATALDRHLESTRVLSGQITRYSGLLAGRHHDFPPWNYWIESLPDSSPMTQRLESLIRVAQRDFEFANILEHRRSQKIMIAGFQGLTEAVQHLENRLVESITDLKLSISNDLARILASQGAIHKTIQFVLTGRPR